MQTSLPKKHLKTWQIANVLLKVLLICETNGTKYSRMDQVKFFKSCLLQILIGPFLNTLSQMTQISSTLKNLKSHGFG